MMQMMKASVEIDAPVDICYEQVLEVTRFPAFMPRILAVHELRVNDQESKVNEMIKVELGDWPLRDERFLTENTPCIVRRWKIQDVDGYTVTDRRIRVLEIKNQMIGWTDVGNGEEGPLYGSVAFYSYPGQHTTWLEMTISAYPPYCKLIQDIFDGRDHLPQEMLHSLKEKIEAEYQVSLRGSLSTQKTHTH